ncbi:MAG: hypothetical protein HPY70_05565 [Firmicutes bacterium]|nr:hypothetical protein [Bacillota bacterium]
MLTQIKAAPGTEWLAEVDKFALQNSLKDLGAAFVNYFEGRAGHPRFKSKRGSKQSFRKGARPDEAGIDETSSPGFQNPATLVVERFK